MPEELSCRKCADRFAEGFYKGQASVIRKNKSGCCCIIDDNDRVVSPCEAHLEWMREAISAWNRRK